MSKKGTRALASATLMSLVLTSALATGPVQAAAGQVTRTSGADRYSTAAQVAKANWANGSKDVVLVTGEGYADAVSASALAKKLNAPILLTTASSLSDSAKDALTTLKPQNIYIVGGNGAISQSIRDGLKSSYNLVELQGANRYETNVAVAKKLVELGVKADNVLLVGGEGFSDALSVAPVAASKGQILLLGNNNADSMKSVLDFVKANSSKVTVVGTTNVISEDMYNKLGAVERVNGGASRFETNMNVLNKYASDLKADKLFVANASGNGYADALVASALAGKTASPLVLVDAEGASATTTAINYIKGKAGTSAKVNIVGGTGVVNENVFKAIDNIFNPTTPGNNGENTVSAINSINLNQFDVVFNSNVDEDTAELLSNYKVAGVQLANTNAHAELISSNTVRITLVKSAFNINQQDEKTVSVKKGILTEDKTKTIETLDKKVEFKDITTPTLKSVAVKGNNKLVVEFSEAVNMKDIDSVKALIEVNGKNLSNIDKAYSAIKESATDGVDTWASKVEFYLTTGLKAGETTVKVKDAKSGVLVDAAGFSFKEASQTVTVDAVTTKPQIKEVTCTDDGEVRVKFDRAMDAKTSINLNYYSINDKAITGAKVELKDDDTVVKITGLADTILKDKTNIIEITNDVKDAYGNKVADDTRVTFEKQKDETKPTVLSSTIIDSKTLRVQFSEDVKYAYATNLDNYELKDAYNVDLMGKDGVQVVATSAASQAAKEDTDTYDIKFTGTAILNSSKYTLTIKDIVDKATEPNKMDSYTVTINGNDTESPKIEDLDVFQKSSTEVAIYFGKEMDNASISNKSNYYYINGDGENKTLPEDADITVSADNKGVVIDFDDANKTIDPSATSGEDKVRQIGIKTVKDASGNELFAGSLTIKNASTTSPALEAKTFKLYKDGNDVKAQFQLDNALDTINPADFKVSGIAADDADFDGRTVTLTFQDGEKADAVQALGVAAELQIKASVTNFSKDIAGRKIADGNQVVYYYAIAPETDRDNYSSTVTLDGTTVTDATITITMKAPVDTGIVGSYKDDFLFTNSTKGTKLDVTDVKQVGHTLVFTIKDAATKVAKGDKIDITTATDASNIDIRTAEDGNGKYVKFVPSDDDKKVKTVTVQ